MINLKAKISCLSSDCPSWTLDGNPDSALQPCEIDTLELHLTQVLVTMTLQFTEDREDSYNQHSAMTVQFFLDFGIIRKWSCKQNKKKTITFFLTFILIMKFTTFLYWGVFSTHINTQSHLLFSSTQSKTIIRHASVNKIYLKEEKFTRPPAALTGLKKWKTVWKQWFTL